jgi:hypothetical protein
MSSHLNEGVQSKEDEPFLFAGQRLVLAVRLYFFIGSTFNQNQTSILKIKRTACKNSHNKKAGSLVGQRLSGFSLKLVRAGQPPSRAGCRAAIASAAATCS